MFQSIPAYLSKGAIARIDLLDTIATAYGDPDFLRLAILLLLIRTKR